MTNAADIRRFAHSRRTLSSILLVVGTLTSATCGKSPTSPTSNLTVASISPASGTTLGGTVVTITGSKFAAGATVTIGGAPATNVTVQGDTMITATTPQHASGATDVIVTAGGKSGTLAAAFTFVPPNQVDNQAPVIASLNAKGTRRNEPSLFADVDDVLNVTATVSDDTTPVDQLDYQWSAPSGTFNGKGASVTWQAPHDVSGPTNVDLTLTVVERYQATNGSGLPVTQENKTTKTVTVSVHNTDKEAGDIAELYLSDFTDQKLSPDDMLRNFAQCQGRSAERDDIVKDLATRTKKKGTLGPAKVTLNFSGDCSFDDPNHVLRSRSGDACVAIACDWHSIKVPSGDGEHSYGTCRLTALYQKGRWWLCDSDFDGVAVGEAPWTTVTSTHSTH